MAVRLSEEYTRAIWDLTEALQGEKQIESALTHGMEIMKETIGCEAGFVWLRSFDGDTLTVIACACGQDMTGVTVGRTQGVVGHVAESAETLVFQHALPKDTPLAGSEDALGVRIESQLVCPLKTPGGFPFGAIQLINKADGADFDDMDVRLANNLTAIIALDLKDKGAEAVRKPKAEPILELRGITKEYRSGDSVLRVLKGIDLDVYPQEFLVILGESGCGKTTLMNIIGGMTPMSEGEMRLDGKDFSHPTAKELTAYRRDYIGFVFQAYNLMPNLNALENLQFIAEISRDPADPMEMLTKVGLKERARNFPSQMSGGQQQRVSIARALTRNPRLILADEPTAALDYETSIEVLSILEKIVKEQQKTVIMITHNPEIAKMADRVVKIRNGLISGIRVNFRPLAAKDLVW